MRTADADSHLVNPGDLVFTILGFAGLYLTDLFRSMRGKVGAETGAGD
jgi:hypothetical protein